jgi:hypothetical protein
LAAHRWYTLADYAWYTLAEHRWYIIARSMTPSRLQNGRFSLCQV